MDTSGVQADEGEGQRWVVQQLSAVVYSTSESTVPPSFHVADIDCDGKQDLVIARYNRELDGVLEIAFADPQRRAFDLVEVEAGAAVRRAADVGTSDFNNDGYPDIVVAKSGFLMYFENPGRNCRSKRWEHRTPLLPDSLRSGNWSEVSAADFDGDSVPEVLGVCVSNERAENEKPACLSWFSPDPYSDGKAIRRITANWTQQLEIQCDMPSRLEMKDLDGDGDLDIVLASQSGLQCFENQSSFSKVQFSVHDIVTADSLARNGFGIKSGSSGMELADVNGDGELDIVTVLQSGETDTLIWFENGLSQGRRWKTHKIGEDRPKMVGDIVAADANLDGCTDLFFAFCPHTKPSDTDRPVHVGWLENIGNASAWRQHSVAQWDNLSNLQLIKFDIDGDGKRNIIAALQDETSHRLILLGQPGNP